MGILSKSKRSDNLCALVEQFHKKGERNTTQVDTKSSISSQSSGSSHDSNSRPQHSRVTTSRYSSQSSVTTSRYSSQPSVTALGYCTQSTCGVSVDSMSVNGRGSSSGSGEDGQSLRSMPSTTECKPSVVVSESTDLSSKSKKHSVYKVTTRIGGKVYSVDKKYSDIQHLADKLRKAFPDCDAVGVKLPAKKFFAHRDALYLAHRHTIINDFMEHIVADSAIFNETLVQSFLGLIASLSPLSRQFSVLSDDFISDSMAESEPVDLGPSENKKVTPGDFQFLQVIGKGSFGKVLLAKHKAEGTLYAVKVVSKSQVVKKNETKHIMSERNVLVKNVKHPFLIGLHYSFQTSNKLYFVLDYVNGGGLFYHLQRDRSFEEPRARFYAAEITSALGYLHSLNIIYRDLKPENILLDSEYLAPEVLLKQPYDKLVDWWCLGAVLYEMIFGLPPFYSRDVNEMYSNILHMPLTFKKNVASSTKNFLQKLLSRERRSRLGFNGDAVEVKGHPFFESINWEQLEDRQIKPPYQPKVTGPLDLSQFDPEFTGDVVPASITRSVSSPFIASPESRLMAADNPFEGFSYVPPDLESFHL